jgi:hypothetical protein
MQEEQPTAQEQAKQQLLSLCPPGTMIYSIPLFQERLNMSVHLYVIRGERLVCIDGPVADLLRLERDTRCQWGIMLPLRIAREYCTAQRASEAVTDLSLALHESESDLDHLDLVHPGNPNWWEWPIRYPYPLPRDFDLWRRVVGVAFGPLHGRALFGEKGVEGRLQDVEPLEGQRLADYFPGAPPVRAWRVEIQVVFPEEFTLAMIVTQRQTQGHWDVMAELLEEEGGITAISRVSGEGFSAWVRGAYVQKGA